MPAGPGAFYNLPALTGSGTLTSSGRKVAAGLFKRQVRSATSPTTSESDHAAPAPETSPLNVRKKGLPGSPRGSHDYIPPARISSVPVPPHLDPNAGQDGQLRSVSNSGLRPESVMRESMVGEDVGIDGAGASAEEAAVHVISDEEVY